MLVVILLFKLIGLKYSVSTHVGITQIFSLSNSGNEFNIIGDGGIYDFESGKWETISGQKSPAARAGHTASVFEDRLVIVGGGESSGGFLEDGFAYNVQQGVWARLTSETEGPHARAGHTSVMVNGQLVIWGGIGKNGLIGDGYIFSFDLFSPWGCTKSNQPSES